MVLEHTQFKDITINSSICNVVKFDELPITSSSSTFHYENENEIIKKYLSNLQPFNIESLSLNFGRNINISFQPETSLANNFFPTEALFTKDYIGISKAKFEANVDKIQNRYSLEFKKYKHYISTDLVEAKKTFDLISDQLARIDFNDILVELSPLNSVKFKIKLDDEKMLIVTKPFHEISEMGDNDVLYSFFIKRERIISDTIRINDLADGFLKYLSE